MLPRELKAEQFSSYPPQARALAVERISVLQRLPLSFVPSLLRELVEYDYKFPAERSSLERELAALDLLSSEQLEKWFSAFSQISISSKLEHFDWVNSPAQFVEQLSAHLWATHELDGFRAAATEYADRLHAAVPAEEPVAPRLGIAVIGKGAAAESDPLFRKLRPHGTYFTRVNPEKGLEILLDVVASRVKAHPLPFAHWYIDGGDAEKFDPAITGISYATLEPVRGALLRRMRSEVEKPGMGPEMLRTIMAQVRPIDVGMKDGDPVLNRFALRLLTEGSGTQIYSTSFTQWAAREALRRVQPLTLMVRFAPRQRQKPMNELLAAVAGETELDPAGSLIDGDMGAYYNWLNQQRLPGDEKSAFLAWFEGHDEAVVIGPTVPRGTQSSSSSDLKQVLSWIL